MNKEIKSGIYAIVNKINGKMYIGSAINIEKRWKLHKYLFKLNKNSKYLQREVNKYGEDNFIFKVIEYVEKEKLIEREQYWIDRYNSSESKNGYNLCKIAGSSLGFKFSKESRKKLSDSRKGDKHPFFGKVGAFFGKKHTLESKQKISKTKKKIGGTWKGKKLSITHKEKITLSRIGGKNSRARKINQYDINGKFIKTWNCIKDVSEYLNRPMYKILRGNSEKYKIINNFIWNFSNDEKNLDKKVKLISYELGRKGKCLKK